MASRNTRRLAAVNFSFSFSFFFQARERCQIKVASTVFETDDPSNLQKTV
jgi:hypothetical protein